MKKTRDELISEARRQQAKVRRAEGKLEDERTELRRIISAARAASPPATLGELAEALEVSRSRIQQLSE